MNTACSWTSLAKFATRRNVRTSSRPPLPDGLPVPDGAERALLQCYLGHRKVLGRSRLERALARHAGEVNARQLALAIKNLLDRSLVREAPNPGPSLRISGDFEPPVLPTMPDDPLPDERCYEATPLGLKAAFACGPMEAFFSPELSLDKRVLLSLRSTFPSDLKTLDAACPYWEIDQVRAALEKACVGGHLRVTTDGSYQLTAGGEAERSRIERESANVNHAGQVDALVICATDREWEYLGKLRQIEWAEHEHAAIRGVLRRVELSSDHGVVSLIAAKCDSSGLVSAAILTTRLIDLFQPRYVGVTGICGAIADGARIGDVVFATDVRDYLSGKKVPGGHEPDGNGLPADRELKAAFDQHGAELVRNAHSDWCESGERGSQPSAAPSATSGPVASGLHVVADPAEKANIRKFGRKIQAVEMEAFGVFRAAAEATSNPKVFMVKAICDLSDESKGDEYQPYAAYVAANVAIELLRKAMRPRQQTG